jgi:hypothetical protein
MAEKAMIVNYILLTSQVVLTLEDAIENKELTEQQYNFLKEGSKLLSRIIEGAMLIEGREFKGGFGPTMEGLSIYGYALSTIQKLDFIKEIKGKEFTEFFEKLHNKMDGLIYKRGKDDKIVPQLKSFFIKLGSSFREDIQKESYYKEKTLPFTLKKQINGYASV